MLISVIAALLMLIFVMLSAMILPYLERKIIGHFQARLGPMRTGFHGILQLPADAVKLIAKEDVIPSQVDRLGFKLAPYVVFVPYFMVFAAIPFYRHIVPASLKLGLFYILAISSLSVLGTLLAGWASNNKYALLGGMRSAAQVVSYELPLVFSVLSVVMIAGSLNLSRIVDSQSPIPFLMLQPVGLFIFFTSGLAELNRSPFDIPHAESEIIAGPHIEYSSIRFGLFQMAEYANFYAVSALVTLIYLGGWNGPFLPGVVWFLLKSYLVVFIIFWIRATFPRLRPDQLMSFCWKYLLPLSLLNLFVTSVFVIFDVSRFWITAASIAAFVGFTTVVGAKRFKLYQRRAV